MLFSLSGQVKEQTQDDMSREADSLYVPMASNQPLGSGNLQLQQQLTVVLAGIFFNLFIL